MTYRMRVGYSKIGRSMAFDPKDFGLQGDAESPQLLFRLARRNPDVEWVVVGRNSGMDAVELPPNVTNGWGSKPRTGQARGLEDKIAYYIGTLDGMVVHAGQHGTSHQSIPFSHNTWEEFYNDPMQYGTTPQDWSVSYGGFLVKGLNHLGDRTNGQAPVVWIVTDPRNYLKARDIKWPTGYDKILSQYAFQRAGRHERFQDQRTPDELGFSFCTPDADRNDEVWDATHTYRYGGLELMILPDDWHTWQKNGFHDRHPAGIASSSFNDGRSGNEPRRSELIRDFLLKTYPNAVVSGKWDPVSLSDVPAGTVQPPGDFVQLLNEWRVTLSLPALGTSWTVAKPMQCAAAGVVCFMVDRLDDQGWLLPSRRNASSTKMVGEVDGVPYYSIREDWTATDLQLAHWLRIETQEEFAVRSKAVIESEPVWQALVNAQRNLLLRRWNEAYCENMIEAQLGLR